MSQLMDVACRYCGERFIEMTDGAAFEVLEKHSCPEVEFFHDTVKGRMQQWQRVTS